MSINKSIGITAIIFIAVMSASVSLITYKSHKERVKIITSYVVKEGDSEEEVNAKIRAASLSILEKRLDLYIAGVDKSPTIDIEPIVTATVKDFCVEKNTTETIPGSRSWIFFIRASGCFLLLAGIIFLSETMVYQYLVQILRECAQTIRDKRAIDSVKYKEYLEFMKRTEKRMEEMESE